MSDATEEQWRPILGWEGYYEASNLGNLRSVERVVEDTLGRRNRLRSRPMKPHVNRNNGRRMITLQGKGRLEKRTVSSVVLEAFQGPRPAGMQCCHSDGNALNDRIENLRWDSHAENERDKVRHGTHQQASKMVCVRGHLLAVPNLLPRRLPHRLCLACGRGRATARYELSQGRSVDLQAMTDHHYARIMKEVSVNAAAG